MCPGNVLSGPLWESAHFQKATVILIYLTTHNRLSSNIVQLVILFWLSTIGGQPAQATFLTSERLEIYMMLL
jgi:hypothetical protein